MSFANRKEIEKKYSIGSGDWLNLSEGDNKIRLVSDCADYGNHFLGNNKFQICIGKEKCELCQQGNRPSVQFLAWVIDRKDGIIKLFRFGYTIYKQIMAYKENPEYAFEGLPPYDITINRKGTGKETEYVVVPARQNTELTAEEKNKLMEKIKEPKSIIEKMKAKVVPNYNPGKEEEEEISEGEVNVEDIPF